MDINQEIETTKSALEPREELFCQAIAKGCKKAEAAIHAGYTPNSAGKTAWSLLKRQEINDRIEILQIRSAELARITSADVLIRLGRTAFFDSKELWEIAKDPDKWEWSREARAAISTVKVKRTYRKGDEDGDLVDIVTEVRARDTLTALKLLSEQFGLLTGLNQVLNTLATYGVKLGRIDGRWQVLEDGQADGALSNEREVSPL